MSPARFRCANQLIVVLNLRYAADESIAIRAIDIPAELFTEKNASWRSLLRLANTDNNDWWGVEFMVRLRTPHSKILVAGFSPKSDVD
jgi:hypothetical protein